MQSRESKRGSCCAAKASINSNRVTWLLMPLFQFYQVLCHSNHLSSCRRIATSSYSQHPFQLPKVRKWVYKVAGATNTLVVLEFLPASSSSAIVMNGEFMLKTHHMRSIRGKMLQELSHWHNSKFTEDISSFPTFIKLRLEQIPLILVHKVQWKCHVEIS